MTLRYLLDTNILSEPMRPQPNSTDRKVRKTVIEKLRLHEKEIATATIVWHELLFSCQRLPPELKKRLNIEKYLEEVVYPHIPILSYNKEATNWHAQERSRLVNLGKTPPFADGQIAAISYVNNLILVTNNISDYQDFHALKLENWHSSYSE